MGKYPPPITFEKWRVVFTMNSDEIESALTTLVEAQDMKHYPVLTLAIQRVIWQLDRIQAQVSEKEVGSP